MYSSFYVAGWNSFRALARGLCVLVSALWAGDGVARRFDAALIPVAHVKGDDAVLAECLARLHGETA